MARYFTASSSERLVYNSTILTAAPMTMACWFYMPTVSTTVALGSIGDETGTVGLFNLSVYTSKVRIVTYNSGTNPQPLATTTLSNNTWHHACGVWAAANDRRVYGDGGGKTTNAVSSTPGSLDNFCIGVDKWNSSHGQHMDGRIAEFGLWNVALTDGQVASLAEGVSPLFIRPDKLVGYWPLGGITANDADYDIVGGVSMTAENTPTTADHPPIHYPSSPIVINSSSAAPAGGGGPFQHYYQLGAGTL